VERWVKGNALQRRDDDDAERTLRRGGAPYHLSLSALIFLSLDSSFRLSPTRNGTEEIIENLVPREETFSFAQVGDSVSSGSHGQDSHASRKAMGLPWCEASFRATKYKPWLDEKDKEEVLFVSVHGHGGRDLRGMGTFYPGSGQTRVPTIKGMATGKSEEGEGEGGGEHGETLVLDVGMGLVDSAETVPGTSRVEWRTAMRKTVLPRLAAFKPDMVFISAGFDAHRKVRRGQESAAVRLRAWLFTHLPHFPSSLLPLLALGCDRILSTWATSA